MSPFNIGVTLVEPGGARTEFRYGSAKVTKLMPEYDGNPAHNFLKMLDASNGLAPGDPSRMAARIIESVDKEPAPLRMVLGSQALASTICYKLFLVGGIIMLDLQPIQPPVFMLRQYITDYGYT